MDCEQFYYKIGDDKKNTQQMLFANATFDVKKVFSSESCEKACGVSVITPSQIVNVAFDHEHKKGEDKIGDSGHAGIADIILSRLYPNYVAPENPQSIYDENKNDNIFILLLPEGPIVIMSETGEINKFQYNELNKYIEEIKKSEYAKEGKIIDVIIEGKGGSEWIEMDDLDRKMQEIEENVTSKDIPEQYSIDEFDFSDCKTNEEIWTRAEKYAEELEENIEESKYSGTIVGKVRENNKQIEQLILDYIEKYKQEGVPLEDSEQAKKVLEYKLGLCLEIYKAEFPQYECLGKKEVHFIEQKGVHPDCYGSQEGLTLTTKKDKWIREVAPNLVSGVKEYVPSNKYIGSTDDMYNYIAYLVNENKTDLDWANEALPHESMHIFGTLEGNALLIEGITEEVARELAEKYALNMAPIAHSMEAEFVRRLEMIVGRDDVIYSGLMRNKNRDNPEFGTVTTKKVTEEFDSIFGKDKLEECVKEIEGLQSEYTGSEKKEEIYSKFGDLMKKLDEYIQEKGLKLEIDNEDKDYTNVLQYQEEMLEYLKEINKISVKKIGKETEDISTRKKYEVQKNMNVNINALEKEETNVEL